MNALESIEPGVVQEPRPALPESLTGLQIAGADGIVSLILLFLAHLLHEGRAALVVIALLLLFAYIAGRYRQSFASVPKDEIYATLGSSVPALVFALVAGVYLRVDPLAIAAVGVIWTAVACAIAVSGCARRRAGLPPVGLAYSVDHVARVRSRAIYPRCVLDACDVVLAALALAVLSPLFLACAAAVAYDSGSPIFFRQRRIGQNDREFVMYKFRTMCVEAGSHWVAPGDRRITRVGRFLRRTSLDELPQLINVLRREMSLVGPRPEMCDYAYRFGQEMEDYSDRHLIPPGITGWAQLNYSRNFAPDEERNVLTFDLFYVRHRSLQLYWYCLVKTLCEVVFHRAV
jgi:lipopolysaccharide/colanic/teichoic acid biosynthesis glycosyltransferase